MNRKNLVLKAAVVLFDRDEQQEEEEKEIERKINRDRRITDAKRGSSGRGGRRNLGRDFGSCCKEGGLESRRGRSPGYPRKRSSRVGRARRGGCRRRWWRLVAPRRRSGRRFSEAFGCGGYARVCSLCSSSIGIWLVDRRDGASGWKREMGEGDERLVTVVRVTAVRPAAFIGGPLPRPVGPNLFCVGGVRESVS